jgi:hypothetical protein
MHRFQHQVDVPANQFNGHTVRAAIASLWKKTRRSRTPSPRSLSPSLTHFPAINEPKAPGAAPSNRLAVSEDPFSAPLGS